jgi:hypothetical protein
MSVFRDDIVFIALCAQRYIYPVDKSRVNEFGQRGEDEGAEPPREAAGAGDAVPSRVSEPKQTPGKRHGAKSKKSE